MLIPSIDLMGGKIVQLVRGEKKALEFENFNYWIEKFSSFALVQLIDLDGAITGGNNQSLVAEICSSLPCQVGGGIRTIPRAHEVIELGARRVILGSSLLRGGAIDVVFAQECARALGPERLLFAVDSRGGKVAVNGWKQETQVNPLEMVRSLEPYCAAFLYTHIDTEGTMSGFPLEMAKLLRNSSGKQIIVAGGIRSWQEIDALDKVGVDAVVGMALYTGALAGNRV